MKISRSLVLQTGLVAALAAAGSALMAQPGMGEDPRWESARGWRDEPRGGSGEGLVQISRFRAKGPAAAALGHGSIAVVAMPLAGEAAQGALAPDGSFNAVFEAAVEDSLVRSGYDAATPAGGTAQVAEVRVIRVEARPADPPRKPVSGAVSMGVSNRGTMLGVGIAVDGTKPRGHLLSTRLEARIRDRASGQVLWEGSAEVLTREGDRRWTDQKIADKLAAGLFTGFPAAVGEARTRR